MKLSCYIVDTPPVSLELIKTYIEKTDSLELLGIEYNPLQAVHMLRTGKIKADLTFLDIEMPELSGIELAGLVGNHTKVVFTTEHRQYGAEAFELNALDYLLKPVTYERFLTCIEKARSVLGISKIVNEQPRYLFIRGTGKGARIRIMLDEIIYIKGSSNYLNFVMKDRTITSYATMENTLAFLPANQFCRVHKSYTVNIAMIDQTDAVTAIMYNGAEIPLGRTYKKEFQRIIENGLWIP